MLLCWILHRTLSGSRMGLRGNLSYLLIALAASACVALALWFTDERNGLLFSTGTALTDRPTVLGVHLGMQRGAAEEALQRYGFTPTDMTVYSPDFDFEACGDEALARQPLHVVLLSDNSWRGGGACLATLDERVVALSVAYMPIEF